MCTLQRVIKLLENVNTSIRTYVLSLLLTKGRKNCAEMASTVGIPSKRLYTYLANATTNLKEIEKHLFDLAKSTRDPKVTRTLVIDPTTLIKRYAQHIENLCHDKAGCTKHIEKGLVPVCASVVDRNIKIPLTLDFWVQKKVIGTKNYKSKAEITQELIVYLISQKVEFDFVSLDGAFASPSMFSFFQEKKLKFIMRIPRNRCAVTSDGKRAQLKFIPSLTLTRNSREKIIQAKLYEETYFFTAQKRQKRIGGWETVFLVSNMDLSAKQQVAAFNLRWPQEKINRTSKQKFGIHQCQVLPKEKQKAHIMAGYLALAIIEVAKNDNLAQSVDVVVNILRNNHFDELVSIITKCDTLRHTLNHDLDGNIAQKHIRATHNNAEETTVLRV